MQSSTNSSQIRQWLEKTAPHYGQKGCKFCRGVGIVYDPFAGTREGAYDLCNCVKELTLCDGNAPYLYYNDEKKAMIPCPSRPARAALERIRLLDGASGIPKRYRGKFIDSFYPEADPEQNLDFALDFAVDVIRNFAEKGSVRGLYLYGPTGSGKTHLSCAILNELIRLYQIEAHYAKISRDILGKLRETFNPQSEVYGEARKIEAALASYPALVIDDFGVHRETPWVNSVLYDLVDTRYENEKLTILTSNEPIESWKDINSGRLYSRLREMCRPVLMDAPDYRLQEK